MLYVVATPIGNMGDITYRAIETLRNVDLIAAEDTRHTLGLMAHYDIKKPIVSYYEHNKMSRGAELLEKLKEGTDIAIVSDAGTPGISDPGHELIRDALDAGIQVTMLPGPVAGITALVLSGFDTQHFTFYGFIGTENKERKIFYETLRSSSYTLIVYEAPHRIVRTLEEMAEVLDDSGRRIAVCRELTKTFEEILRGTPSELLTHFRETAPRGEFVLVIEGKSGEDEKPSYSDEEVIRMVEELIASGMKRTDACKEAAAKTGRAKNDIYKLTSNN